MTDMSTGYEPFITVIGPSHGEHSSLQTIHSSPEGSDMSEVAVLEMSGKQFVRRKSGDGKARSTSRTTLAIAAHARVAPKSAPVIIQVPASLHTAASGVRRSTPDSGPLYPSDFRGKGESHLKLILSVFIPPQ